MDKKQICLAAFGVATSAFLINSLPSLSIKASDARAQAVYNPNVATILGRPLPKGIVSTAKMTNFDPAQHGFRFINTFRTVTGVFDFTTGGLCGGMAWAALDYYKSGRARPEQNFTPVNGTTLQSYLYARTMTAIESHLDKYVELNFNPLGARNSEFYRWGLQGTGGGRLQELRAKIDAGEPIPLGLKSLTSEIGSDHVVLAYGYDMGRYTGDMGAHTEDLKIFIYEPNYGARRITLVPKPDRQQWCYQAIPGVINEGEKCWQTYFVQQNYRTTAPPVIPAGPQKELLVTLETGNDDLRGGNIDRANVEVSLARGRTARAENVNLSQRWMSGTTNIFGVSLPADTTVNDVQSMQIQTLFTGGIHGDNWNINQILMEYRENGATVMRCKRNMSNEGTMRLTASQRNVTFPFPCGNQLWVNMRTGGDDLRGGSDNVGLTVSLRNGTEIDMPNINQGRAFGGNSNAEFRLPLPANVRPGDVTGIQIKTNFGGGLGGDNWNLDAFHAYFLINEVIAARCLTGNADGGSLLQRFTASDQKRNFAFPC